MNVLKKISIQLLLVGVVLLDFSCCQHNEDHFEVEPYDGWYNNFANPSWGAAETPLFRRIAPHYGDGAYEPSGQDRPNPIDISLATMNGSTGEGSVRNRTAFLVFFGQQVVEEILDAQRPGCPPEYFNIPIPKGHFQYDNDSRGGREMPFLRSRYDQRTGFSPQNPRQQLNEITAWIDGGLMYGPNKAWADALRSFKGGRLKEQNKTESERWVPAENTIRLPMANPPPPRDHTLKPIKRFYLIGNPRGNENPFLLTFGILWFRYHNYRARQIEAVHSDWSDERIFNTARKWVIAVHQKIVMYDWLPAWLNETLPTYSGYDPTVHPGIAQEFQSAAMRFGHTLVPPGVYRRNATCDFRNTTKITGMPDSHHHKALRTCNTYWNPQEPIQENDIDEILMGMASQIAEREDNIITPDLRGDVFGPLEFSRRDLMAVNIQRARDHGIPDYNTVRIQYGLDPKKDFPDINEQRYNDPKYLYYRELLDKRLREVYNNDISKVDLWVGGLLETVDNGPGEIFRTIIKDQFRRIRDADRFWYENERNGLFTDTERGEINMTTIYDIVRAVTNIPESGIQKNPFFYATGDPCPQPAQLKAEDIAPCTPLKHFDYFTESEVSFALSFLALGLLLFVIIGALLLLARRHEKQVEAARNEFRRASKKKSEKGEFVSTIEWVGKKEGSRNIRVKLDADKKHIMVQSERGKVLRTLDLSLTNTKGKNTISVILSADRKRNYMVIRVEHEIDLVLDFEDHNAREMFREDLENFLTRCGIGREVESSNEKDLFAGANTKARRQKLLERFFRVVFAHAFDKKGGGDLPDVSRISSEEAASLINCELTQHEFAEALSLKANSMFVVQMFQLVDKDNNGYLSFREFLDMIVIFAKGTPEEKAKLLFDMYDVEQNGELTRDDFRVMLKSMLELANAELDDSKMDDLIQSMFQQLGDKKAIKFKDFQVLLKDYERQLQYAALSFSGAGVSLPEKAATSGRETGISRARRTIIRQLSTGQSKHDPSKRHTTVFSQEVEKSSGEAPRGRVAQKMHEFSKGIEIYKLHIFWLFLYTLVCIGVFAERAYYYSVEREHAGLRRIAGYGVTVTRGAASGMMFTFPCLLVTMCRNLITFLRETALNRYIPFDAAVAFHKWIAAYALVFTLMHCIGHGINFYHISTQTANDLTCLFRNFFHATDELPKFHYWCWQTITGVTGVLLTVIIFLMYTFGIQYSRRHAFKAFWITHNLYVVLFILMFLHGAGRLVQPPFFHYFSLGPILLFLGDQLISVSRKKVELPVVKAELLPSDVTYLEFQRPPGFDYQSGQWVRIAILVQGKNEYHPFTLTSAPHEKYLSLHIRAVGPWTYNLRKTYDPAILGEHSKPTVYLDGPYGEGHQDWYKYDVAVLVGGGIGVTPFASILKDIAFQSKNPSSKINCKKVYFIWVTRTQKQFEWVTDILREVEEKDTKGLVSTHIFITQFREKFDIRTTMLYICERYFERFSGRSLFTGLQAVTHFGRPDFTSFLESLHKEHNDTSVFGVFSCGPPPMTNNVESACNSLNRKLDGALFDHHFENF